MMDYDTDDYDTDDYEYQQDLASGMIVLDGSLEAREMREYARERRNEIINELMQGEFTDEALDYDPEFCREQWLDNPENVRAVDLELDSIMEEWM